MSFASRSRFLRCAPILVLAIGLLSTGLIVLYLIGATRRADELQMLHVSQRVSQTIEERMGRYTSLLRAGSALFESEQEQTGEGLRNFVRVLDLEENYPGIRGIGFARRVEGGEREAFEASRRERDPAFEILPPGVRGEYFPVVFFQARPGEQMGTGFDLWSDAALRMAMSRARETGETVASGIVNMGGGEPGFVILAPTFQGGYGGWQRKDERMETLSGFLFSPFNGSYLFAGIFREGRPRVQFSVYAGPPDPENLLYATPVLEGHEPRLSLVDEIQIAGHPWSIVYSSTPFLETTPGRTWIPWIAGAGLAFTLILFGITGTLTKTTARAERSQREEAEQRERLRVTLASIGDAVVATDAEGRITFMNPVAEELAGWKLSEAQGKQLVEVIRLVAESNGKPIPDPVRRVLEENKIVEPPTPASLLSRDDVMQPIDDSAAPIRDGRGTVIGIVLVFRDVSEKRERDRKVHVLAETLRGTLESISDGFASFDRDWTFTYVNTRAANLLGKRVDELLGHRLWDVFPRPEESEISDWLLEAIERDETSQLEAYSPVLGIWLSLHAYPAGDAISFYFQDITQRKLNEQRQERRARETVMRGDIALALSGIEKNRAQVLQSCVEAVFRSFPSAGCVCLGLVNAETGEMEVRASAGAEGNEPLCGPKELAKVATMRRRVVSDQAGIIDCERARERGWRTFVGFPLLVEDHLIGALTVFAAEDISEDTIEAISSVAEVIALGIEHRRAEDELIRSEERFRTIVRSATDYAIFTLDKNGIVTSWNPGAEEIMGYREEEILNQDSRILWTAEDRAAGAPEREMEKAEREGRAVDERWHQCKEKQSFWALGTLMPLRDASGEVYGFLKILRDFTERKKMEEALTKAREELSQYAENLEEAVAERTARLQELVSELEAFSYSISHDMRAPLRAIHGMAQVLLEDYGQKIGPDGSEYLQRLTAAAQRLEHLIQDVLSYSRLVRTEIKLEPVDLMEVLKEIIRDYPDFQAPRANVQIREPLQKVMGQEASLVQCITNLMTNAVKFVAPGTKPEVEIWTEPVDSRIRFFVKDNGIGIEPAHHERIFNIFERIHPQKTYSGTGIGLAIVRKAVERMGGTIGLESEIGKGSTFWIELPEAEEQADAST